MGTLNRVTAVGFACILALAACDSQRESLSPNGPLAQLTTDTKVKAPLTLTPTSLTFTALGSQQAETLTAIVQSGGRLTVDTIPCVGIATVSPTQGKADRRHGMAFVVRPAAAGNCTLTVMDKKGNTASVAVAVTTASSGYRLGITTEPADTARSGVRLARQPVIQLRDPAGNNIVESGVSITADIAVGGLLGDSSTLSGTTTVQTNNGGQAVFTDLAITGAGEHRLLFKGTGLIPDTSAIIMLPIPLSKTVPVTALSSVLGGTRWFVVQVPSGASQLTIRTTGGIGNADLYVRYDSLPSFSTTDCSSTGSTANEQCLITSPSGGLWFVLLHGVTSYSDVTLSATLAGGCTLTSPGDADGDRLPDCVETRTGVFVDTLNTGTDPNNPDTDGDGISDGDEVLGSPRGLELPALGVHPLRKDILIEYDWFDDANECGFHSHRPTPKAIARVTAAFVNAPVGNPDGSTGINLISDYGQGGVFTGGNLIIDADGVLDGWFNSEFAVYKAANFDPKRAGYFHYTMMPHRYAMSSNSSGAAEIGGDDLIVSLYCSAFDNFVANTIMHELGHNLNLLHGGVDGINYKPNYNSIMNYRYQFSGIDNNCTPYGDDVLDYSVGALPNLDENNLNEPAGLCGNPPGLGWDWNGDGDILDVGIAMDLNWDRTFNVLRDNNDWPIIFFGGLSDDLARAPKAIITCDNPAPAKAP